MSEENKYELLDCICEEINSCAESVEDRLNDKLPKISVDNIFNKYNLVFLREENGYKEYQYNSFVFRIQLDDYNGNSNYYHIGNMGIS